MTGLYLFAAAAGVPLVLWFVLSGGEEGDGGGPDDGIAGVMFRRLPVSTMAFAAAAFGVCGLLLTWAGGGGGSTFVAAVIAGVVAGALNSALFAYLRRSESTTEIGDEQLTGKIGRVVVPVTGERRGRIAVTVGDQQIQLSARALPNQPAAFDVGAPVLVVEVRNGIADVASLDPELT
ncbi:MAG: hypothetical protein M3203_03135 [Actinomycetota bacterium]|nr:hypothetical protein [Actinomycetota bacterium]